MKMGTRLSIVVVLVCGCRAAASDLQRGEVATSQPAPRSCKPEAPIAIQLATRTLGNGELEIAVRATPSTAVPTVELGLVLPAHAIPLGRERATFGATRDGETRLLVTRVRVDQRSSAVSAFARVPVAGIVMSRAVEVAIGDPVPPPRTRTYVLPDGERAREVRP